LRGAATAGFQKKRLRGFRRVVQPHPVKSGHSMQFNRPNVKKDAHDECVSTLQD
jgi:hypothetical protein